MDEQETTRRTRRPTMKTYTFRLPAAWLDRIARRAALEGRSTSEWLRSAIRAALKRGADR